MAFPNPVINGINEEVINEQQISFKPFSGGEYGGTMEGPDAIIFPWVQRLYNFGFSVDYKHSKSPFSTLTYRATFSANGASAATNPNLDYQDTWEMVRNVVQKEILETGHPLVSELSSSDFDFLKSIFAGQQKIIPGTIESFFDGSGTPGIVPNGGALWTPGTSIAAAVYLYQLWSAGVKTFPVKQPIVRLTRTTNPQYDAPFNMTNIDTVLTTSGMLLDSGIPSNFAINAVALAYQLMLASGTVWEDNQTGLVYQQPRTDGLLLHFGWLKELTSSNKHGDKRIQYVLEYQFGLWDQILYGQPQGPTP